MADNYMIYAGDYNGEPYYFYTVGRSKAYHKSDRFQYDGFFDNKDYTGKQVPFSFVAKNFDDLRARIKRGRPKFSAMMRDEKSI